MNTTKEQDKSNEIKTLQDIELRINESINILQKARDYFVRCKSFLTSP
jgi:hypothetical protein